MKSHYRILFLFNFFFFLFFILKAEAQDLHSGDLIFRIEGNSSFSNAITESTAFNDSIKTIHVGIIENDRDSVWVIEADPEEGVRRIPFHGFLLQSPNGVIVKRLDKNFNAGAIIQRAKNYLSQPYDWWYLPDNGKIYCSELVWETFIDDDGNRLFDAKPMNFRDKDGNLPQFWIDLFEKLDTPVPENVPGTNPQDMFNLPELKLIWSNKF